MKEDDPNDYQLRYSDNETYTVKKVTENIKMSLKEQNYMEDQFIELIHIYSNMNKSNLD